MDPLLFEKILLSLAIGALIGIERERHAKADMERWRLGKSSKKKKLGRKLPKAIEEGEVFAGLRTFMLISLFGLFSSHISMLIGSMYPVFIGIASVAILAFISYYLNYRKFNSIGMTTEVAFFLTFLIGILVYFEAAPFYTSVSLGILITLILFFRDPMHAFAASLTKTEIRDAIVFAALLFVVYPILPKTPIGPFGAINLSLAWESMLVVMLVSFAGYVAMKMLGDRLGAGVAGVFGGLASSTSVAIMMSQHVKKDRKSLQSALFTITVSSSTMFFRMAIVSLIFGYPVGYVLLPIFTLMSTLGYILSLIPYFKMKRSRASIKLDSPIAFRPIIEFMFLFVVVMMGSKISQAYFPDAIFVIAVISGLFDVDAINISMSSMAFSGMIPVKTAVLAIMIAALSNTASKAGLVRWIGGKELGFELCKLFAILMAVGAGGLAMVNLFI